MTLKIGGVNKRLKGGCLAGVDLVFTPSSNMQAPALSLFSENLAVGTHSKLGAHYVEGGGGD